MSRTGDAVRLDIIIIGPDGGKYCAAGGKNAMREGVSRPYPPGRETLWGFSVKILRVNSGPGGNGLAGSTDKARTSLAR